MVGQDGVRLLNGHIILSCLEFCDSSQYQKILKISIFQIYLMVFVSIHGIILRYFKGREKRFIYPCV